jgi:hypothetical protein
MSNIFDTVLTDLQGVENSLLGPAYPYYKNIKPPNEIGISNNGTISALANDVQGLIAYVGVLVDGNCNLAGIPCASTSGGPLGNKFFLKTGAKCEDVETGEQVDRYIYVDNVPDGNIPFVSQGLGVNFTQFQGLIPGAMSNLNVLNPYSLLQSFLSGSMPKCRNLTMQTISSNNVVSSETQYVTLTDIKNMDPCSFSGGSNPQSGARCNKIGFSNMNNYNTNNYSMNNYPKKKKENNNIGLPKDLSVQIYFASLAVVGIYILYKFMEKK